MNTPQHSQPQLSTKGFTMVEMLVSISIIVVLATIGFLSMRKAKEAAGAAVDATEMRTITSAVVMFAGDNNDLLPTTSGGISPSYRKGARDLKMELYPYFGYENPQDGDFMPEFAAASWQSVTSATDGFGPSLLIIDRVYTGQGKPSNPNKPDPYIQPFGYPYGNGKRAPMSLSATMAKMTDASNSLMLIEIDQLVPGLGKPGWISSVPEKMAHGTYRLGLYWDGHVGRLNVALEPL